ncbi:hypothetical protein NL676_007884 [Syzygium grande]|nr:hypothetical protein NL676_007884 [Syzygium grande]
MRIESGGGGGLPIPNVDDRRALEGSQHGITRLIRAVDFPTTAISRPPETTMVAKDQQQRHLQRLRSKGVLRLHEQD